MIKVNFRVTGMYLGNSPRQEGFLTIEVKPKPTVYDIMKAFSKMAHNNKNPYVKSFVFSPARPSAGDTINAIYIDYKKPPRTYLKKGLYVLQDNSTTNPITTFQYYIYDENFKQLNNNNKSKKFSEMPDVEIKNDYTVIIRQVSILMEPTNSNYISNKVKGLNEYINQD